MSAQIEREVVDADQVDDPSGATTFSSPGSGALGPALLLPFGAAALVCISLIRFSPPAAAASAAARLALRSSCMASSSTCSSVVLVRAARR